MKATEIRERSIVIAGTSLCVLAATMAWLLRPDELTLPLALVSLVPPLGVAFARAKRNGLVDPLAVFALCFAAYNGVLLVRFNYEQPDYEAFAPIGAALFRAAVLSGLGSLGLVVGWLLSKSGRREPVTECAPSEATASFITGIAFYLAGIGLYMAEYWQMGGYIQSVAMDRGQRWEALTHVVSMPYEGFILVGLSLMIYASVGISKSRLMLSSSACLLWLVLVLLQGDRRLALQMILAIAVVIGTLRPKITKLRPIALVCIAGGYCVAVIFGQYRSLIYDLAAGRSTLKQAQIAAGGEDSIMAKPENSELGGPYVSVLYYSTSREPLRWGSSYAMSIPSFVPRALYPGVKVPAISADLDQALYEGIGPVYGLGFSPVAEGSANFGLVGPFVVMMLWAMFFAWVGSNRYRGLAGMVICATLLQEAVNANRIDFRYVYLEVVYCAAVVPVALVIMKAVADISNEGRNSVRGISSSTHFIPARRSNVL